MTKTEICRRWHMNDRTSKRERCRRVSTVWTPTGIPMCARCADEWSAEVLVQFNHAFDPAAAFDPETVRWAKARASCGATATEGDQTDE